MFNTRTNNNGNNVSVNTRLYTSYSDACAITLGGWNTNLSLKVAPFKGVDANGLRQYAQDSTETIMTSLTLENTTALLEGINDKIFPAIEAKEEKSVSVSIGNNNNRKVVTVATNGEDVFLKVTVGVSDAGIADANNTITHKFNKKEYLINYDSSTGSGETVSTHSDFKNFVKKLNYIYKFDGAVPHSIKYADALKGSFNNNRTNFTNSSTASYTAPTTNVQDNDMSSFLPFN